MNIKIVLSRENIILFFLALLCVCLLSPLVMKTIGSMAVLLIAALCLLSEIRLLARCKVCERNTIILIVLYLAVFLLYYVLGISVSSSAQNVTRILFFLPFVCLVPFFSHLNKRQMRFLLTVSLVVMAFTMIWNYYLKIQWGYRYSYQLSSISGIRGIVNTQYTSAIMLLSGGLFCSFLHARTIAQKYLSLAGVALCMLFNILVTQRTIAFLLSILMYILLILANSPKRSPRRIVISILSIAILFYIMLDYDTILSWLANITGSTRFQTRIDSLTQLFQTQSMETLESGSLRTRIRLAGVSINTFFQSFSNFFLGVGHRTDSNLLVGNHSQLVDEFARFGIFGGVLSSAVVYRMLRDIRIKSNIKLKTILWQQFGVILFVAFLRMCVGTLFDPSIGAVLFIILPILFQLIETNEGNEGV